MAEYIVRETGSPGVVKQETIGELVRCKECKWHSEGFCNWLELMTEEEFFCADGQGRIDAN